MYFAATNTEGVRVLVANRFACISSQTLCVGVAVASAPAGPWVDSGSCLVYTPGMGEIDPSFFRDDDGSLYLLWKSGSHFHQDCVIDDIRRKCHPAADADLGAAAE